MEHLGRGHNHQPEFFILKCKNGRRFKFIHAMESELARHSNECSLYFFHLETRIHIISVFTDHGERDRIWVRIHFSDTPLLPNRLRSGVTPIIVITIYLILAIQRQFCYKDVSGGVLRMAGWRDGGMAGWRDGGMAGWRDGGMAGWRDGGMAGWRNGGMA